MLPHISASCIRGDKIALRYFTTFPFLVLFYSTLFYVIFPGMEGRENGGKFPELLRLDELRGPTLEVQDTTVYCR